MQMRLAGIAGTAHATHQLSTAHAFARLDSHASRLHVQIVGELFAAEIDGNGVSGNGIERNRHRRVECLVVSGDIVGKTVARRDDEAIRDGKHGFSVGVIRPGVPRVPRERGPVFDLFPIDGVSPRDYRAAIDDKDPTPMMIVRIIAGAVSGKPVWSFEWWSEEMQGGVMGC